MEGDVLRDIGQRLAALERQQATRARHDENLERRLARLSAGGGLAEVAEVSNPTVAGSFTDISTDTYAADDWVTAQLVEEVSPGRVVSIPMIKFGDIPSYGVGVTAAGSGGGGGETELYSSDSIALGAYSPKSVTLSASIDGFDFLSVLFYKSNNSRNALQIECSVRGLKLLDAAVAGENTNGPLGKKYVSETASTSSNRHLVGRIDNTHLALDCGSPQTVRVRIYGYSFGGGGGSLSLSIKPGSGASANRLQYRLAGQVAGTAKLRVYRQ